MRHNPAYNQQLIGDIASIIEVPDMPVYFPQPVIVKSTPHTELFRCYGCVLTNDGEIKLMDANQEWSAVETNQANVGYVLQTLFQRLKMVIP